VNSSKKPLKYADGMVFLKVPADTEPAAPAQRIIKIRRDYNIWVADETLEDYALRFTPRSVRKWSIARVANTAYGAIAFLALEAIGATIALNYGINNAVLATDQLLLRSLCHRYGFIDAWRRLWLFRLNTDLANLCFIYVYFICH
jgi:hypothetical protein